LKKELEKKQSGGKKDLVFTPERLLRIVHGGDGPYLPTEGADCKNPPGSGR
jgi:hypothetical protein